MLSVSPHGVGCLGGVRCSRSAVNTRRTPGVGCLGGVLPVRPRPPASALSRPTRDRRDRSRWRRDRSRWRRDRSRWRRDRSRWRRDVTARMRLQRGNRNREGQGGGAWRGGPPPRPQAGGQRTGGRPSFPAWSLVTGRALAEPMKHPAVFSRSRAGRESALAGGRGRTGGTPPRQPTPGVLLVYTADRERQTPPRQPTPCALRV
jgi:hypothetical protein